MLVTHEDNYLNITIKHEGNWENLKEDNPEVAYHKLLDIINFSTISSLIFTEEHGFDEHGVEWHDRVVLLHSRNIFLTNSRRHNFKTEKYNFFVKGSLNDDFFSAHIDLFVTTCHFFILNDIF